MNLINVILSVLVTAITVILTIQNLMNVKLPKRNILMFIIIFLPLSIIVQYYFTGIYKLSLTIFVTILSLMFTIFNKNVKKAIYYTIIYELFAFLVEILLSVIFVVLLKLDLNSYQEFSFSLLAFSICNSLIVYIITKMKIVSANISKLLDKILKYPLDWIYIICVFILLILLIVYNGATLNNSFPFYINAGAIIVIFISLVYLIYNKIKSENLESKYNDMIDYLSKYEKVINEQGKKNHEYNNQLMVLKGYLDKPDKLEEYLNLIIEDHKCGQNYMIKQLSYFPEGGIKGLIYHKISKMEECGIKPYLYIDSKLKDVFEENLDINTYKDVTKLLGVFLDNAIDATKDSDKKEIDFEIKREDECLIITISNSYNKDCDVSQIGKKGFSTKGIGHGFGLSIVKDISRTNENIETFSNNENDKFKQTIIVYYK